MYVYMYVYNIHVYMIPQYLVIAIRTNCHQEDRNASLWLWLWLWLCFVTSGEQMRTQIGRIHQGIPAIAVTIHKAQIATCNFPNVRLSHPCHQLQLRQSCCSTKRSSIRHFGIYWICSPSLVWFGFRLRTMSRSPLQKLFNGPNPVHFGTILT